VEETLRNSVQETSVSQIRETAKKQLMPQVDPLAGVATAETVARSSRRAWQTSQLCERSTDDAKRCLSEEGDELRLMLAELQETSKMRVPRIWIRPGWIEVELEPREILLCSLLGCESFTTVVYVCWSESPAPATVALFNCAVKRSCVLAQNRRL